jgi:hypothetical protein
MGAALTAAAAMSEEAAAAADAEEEPDEADDAGEEDAAEGRAREFADVARRLGVLNRSLLSLADRYPFARALASLFAGCESAYHGRLVEARQLWRHALSLSQQQRLRYYEARAHFLLGCHLSVLDPRHRRHLLDARTLFAELGARRDADLAAQALVRLAFADLAPRLQARLSPLAPLGPALSRFIDTRRSRAKAAQAGGADAAAVAAEGVSALRARRREARTTLGVRNLVSELQLTPGEVFGESRSPTPLLSGPPSAAALLEVEEPKSAGAASGVSSVSSNGRGSRRRAALRVRV